MKEDLAGLVGIAYPQDALHLGCAQCLEDPGVLGVAQVCELLARGRCLRILEEKLELFCS